MRNVVGTIEIRLREILRESIFYNYLFVAFELAYSFILRDRLLDESMGALFTKQRAPVLGSGLIVMLGIGLFAVAIKTRELRAAGRLTAYGPLFVLWFLSMTTTLIVALIILNSFGLGISTWPGTIAFIAIIWGYFIYGWAILKLLLRLDEPLDRPPCVRSSIAANVFAVIFTCGAYTVVWESIVCNFVSIVGKVDILTFRGIFALFGWAIAFLLLYPPLRLPFLLGEIADIREGRGRVRLFLSYAAVIVAGLLPLVKLPF